MIQSKDIGNYVLYTDGRIWGKVKNDWMNYNKNSCGYLFVRLLGKKKYVHRVITEAFLANPLNLPEVDHINNNKQDNRVENLQWISRSGNIKKAYTDGIMDRKGILHGRSKVTEEQARAIKYNHPTLNTRQLAQMYPISSVNIGRIRNGKSWSHI